ncbi:zinc finger protein 813-like isoform X2 [Artemia franciscana]|uniref:zinc finger protein 813-like isoform X2 n=1 Tax=Artemia franciscana TaxID=6661 RepID=UPI0032DA3189
MAEHFPVSEESFIKNVEDALLGDNEKVFDIPNYLFVKCEDVPTSISVPCKLENGTQELDLEPICSDNQGYFFPHVSELHLQANTSLVNSKDPCTSVLSNLCSLESEANGLYNQKKSLKSHLQSRMHTKLERRHRQHKEKKIYKCEVCDKIYSEARNLKRHQRLHRGEKPFKCDVCDKTFSQAEHSNLHQRVHTGEKPFKCDICDKTFSHSANLNTHQRLHTGEKPFKCYVCDKTFSHTSNLNTHKRMHTGEKPFKCDVCDKTFSQLSNLKRHRRLHTG